MVNLESIGACELVSDMLQISVELTRRQGELDRIDLYRILRTIENLALVALKELSREELQTVLKDIEA
jgi:hypothetical protein